MKNSQIAIATATSYKNWYKGAVADKNRVDKIRGDLALSLINKTVSMRFKTVVLDGGSSQDFLDKIGKLKVSKLDINFSGTFSGGRRKLYETASKLNDIKVIVWTEPEKANLINDSLISACREILLERSDIVVPHRPNLAFSSLPPYQEESEKLGNRQIQEIVEEYLSHKFPALDYFFGPKIFVNKPEIVNLFLTKFAYKKNTPKNEITLLERWSNALTFPLISALIKGYKITDFNINYVHPKQQTAIETENSEFDKKRVLQRESLIKGIKQLIAFYQDPNSSALFISK